jgi:hypothetical protein
MEPYDAEEASSNAFLVTQQSASPGGCLPLRVLGRIDGMFPCGGDEAFPWRMIAEPFSVAMMIELSSQQNLREHRTMARAAVRGKGSRTCRTIFPFLRAG